MALDFGLGTFDGGALDASLPSVFDTAIGFNSSPTYAQPRTADTATSNALQSSQPIVDATGGWNDFWRGTIGTLVNYAVVKDVAETRADGTAAAAAYAAQSNALQTRANDRRLMLLVGAGLVAYLLVVKR